MRSPLAISPLLPAAIGFGVGITTNVSGETTTFTYSGSYMVIGILVGLMMAGLGAAIMWGTRLSLANKGWLGWIFFMAGMVVLIALTATPAMYVRLSPKEVEIKLASTACVLPIRDIARIETRRLQQMHHGFETHYTFHLRDGSKEDFTGNLVGSAVEELTTNPRFGFTKDPKLAQSPPAAAVSGGSSKKRRGKTAATPPPPPSVETVVATNTQVPQVAPQTAPSGTPQTVAEAAPQSVPAVIAPAPQPPVVSAPPPHVPVEEVIRKLREGTIDLGAKGQAELIVGRFARWVPQAERLVKELTDITDDVEPDNTSLRRVGTLLPALGDLTSVILRQALADPEAIDDAPLAMLPVETRQQVIGLNMALQHEQARIRQLTSEDVKELNLGASLDNCILPDWFVTGRAPTADELSTQKHLIVAAGDPTAQSRNRNYREEARRAMTFNKPQNAVALLRAALLASDNTAIVDGTLWSPALRRPLILVQWAFGVETKNVPGMGPFNLLPAGGVPAKPERSTAAEDRLARQLKSLTGDMGHWLAQGLQNRVDSGCFGDWGQELRRGTFDHRGITLLDVAPVENLIAAARLQHADVLMAISLTMNGNSNGVPMTTAIVQVYDVVTGEKLWESKPVSNSRILTARRQGRDLAAEFASTVLEFIDQEIMLREVPKISAATVRERLEAIDSHPEADPLTALIELRYFQLTQQISEAGAQKRLAKILGAEGAKALVSTDEQHRAQALEKLVPARVP